MIQPRRIISLIFIVPLVVLSIAVFSPLPAAPQQPGERKATKSPPEVVEDDIVTRRAVCRWAAQPPVLDGKLDDKCWQKGAVIDHFASYWTKTPRQGTFAYLVWDDEALYYAASMTDAELRSFGTQRNDTLWEGDVFELFFKPSADKPAYFEFQANPKMLVFEMAFPSRGRHTTNYTAAPLLGHKAVVALNGTLDKPGDRDLGWSVEGRIPWSAFANGEAKPKPGDEWFFALCRYDYGPKGTEPILMSSAPLTQPNYHRYEDYGKLRFEGSRERGR